MATDEERKRANELAKSAVEKFRQRNFEGSLADLSEAIVLDGGNPIYWAGRGTLKHLLKRNEEAIVDLDEAIRLSNGVDDIVVANYWHFLGKSKYNLGRYPEAITALNKTICLNPSNHEACCHLGMAKAKLAQYKESIKDYDEAIRLNDSVADYWFLRSVSKVASQKHKKALKDCRKATVLDEYNSKHWFLQGDLNALLKNYKKSIADFSKAIALDSNNPFLFFARGQVKIRAGHYDEALEDFEHYVMLSKNAEESSKSTAKQKYEKAKIDVESHRFSKHFRISVVIYYGVVFVFVAAVLLNQFFHWFSLEKPIPVEYAFYLLLVLLLPVGFWIYLLAFKNHLTHKAMLEDNSNREFSRHFIEQGVDKATTYKNSEPKFLGIDKIFPGF